MRTALVAVVSLVVLVAAILLSLYFKNYWLPSDEKNATQRMAFSPLEILMHVPFRQVDEMCSPKTNYCFTITDRVDNITGRILGFRGLRLKGPDGVLLLSEARLLLPKPLTFRTMDTKLWKVDKTTVRLTYARTMLSGLLFSEALQLDSAKEHKVLIIGLGGGVLNNYLSAMPRPKVDITVVDIDPIMKEVAKKWYAFKETPRHRIVIEDGVAFVNKAADKGQKYDGVLLDLCINQRRPLLCPIEEFLTEEAISNLAAVVAETGVLIVNIITSKEAFNEANRILERFKEHFPSCILLPAGGLDRMLFCFHKNELWDDSPEKLHKLVMMADEETGFHLKDGQLYIASKIE